MNKFTFQFLSNMMDELKINQDHPKEAIEKIKSALNNELTIPCINIVINNSTVAQNFYGMIVFPKTVLSDEKGIEIKSYVIEIQKQLLDTLSGKELSAMLIHDLSHNVMTYTAIERYKAALYHACKMSNMKVIDVMYNLDTKARDLALLDISNRTYKEPVVPDTEIYEADRILIDMGIWEYFNSSIVSIQKNVEEFDLSNPENQDIADNYIATIMIKIVMEKAKGIMRAYTWHRQFVERTYDTNIFKLFPSIDIELKDEQFGEKVSQIESLKPYELSMLQESTMQFIGSKQGKENSSLIIESVLKQKRPNTITLQKELDIIAFKCQGLSSNYERLSLLDRVYDNIYMIEKYLEQNPEDETIKTFLDKFLDLPRLMKDMKPAKKHFDIFLEYPPGYQG